MADAVTIRVKGAESVDRAYQTIRDGAAAMPTTEQSIANLIVPAVRGAAPKRTGRLAASIGAGPTGGGVRLTVGAVYGGVIEWGWAARGIRGRHYVARGVMANQERIRQLYTDGLTAVCDQAQQGK